MRMFEEWNKLQNTNCKVIINHTIFDDQSYDCDMLQIINDEHRIGVVIKGQEKILDKNDVADFWTDGFVYCIKDNLMSIHVIVNKM